jgi:hypothetical protein
MIMDPRELRADDDALRGVDPLVRARLRMEAGEVREAREQAEREAAKVERAALRRAHQDQADRCELAAQGFLDREVKAAHAQAQAQRQARAAELRAELDRLEGREWRAPQAGDVARWQDTMLARHQAGAAEWSTGPCMRARQASLQAEIRRSAPPPVSAATGRLAPVDRDAGDTVPPPAIGGRVPPLSAPEFAHLLPGDW